MWNQVFDIFQYFFGHLKNSMVLATLGDDLTYYALSLKKNIVLTIILDRFIAKT
jgi:hypothetical protein